MKPRKSLPVVLALVAGFVHAAVPSVAAQLAISREDCARLVEHRPAPDVAYEPGVDVYGREVAPADLPDSVQVRLDDIYVFELATRPLDNPDLEATDLFLGQVVVDDQGRVYFKGQPLQDESQAELSRRCQVQLLNPQDR